MPDENELEELTNSFLDGMMAVKGVDLHGRKAGQTEVVGTMGECGRSGSVSGENVRKD